MFHNNKNAQLYIIWIQAFLQMRKKRQKNYKKSWLKNKMEVKINVLNIDIESSKKNKFLFVNKQTIRKYM